MLKEIMKNLKVLDTLLFGFSNPKNFHSSQYHPVILCGAEGEVAESIIQNNPRPRGEGGSSKAVGEDQARTLPPPLIGPGRHLFPRETRCDFP